MLLTPALGRQRQVDLCEFEASLVYRVSSRTAREGYVERDLLSKKGGGGVSKCTNREPVSSLEPSPRT
jgi:hypothetical protein